MTLVILIVFAVLGVAFGPLAGIWALNTLFGLTIAYTFKTWLAAIVLAVIIGSTSKMSRK